ncbi:putative aldouronate transport system permease protein [Paenibacillus sp. 1_12]|uniref:ABC transporter permease n=1 Tax=Paenibacillus sp. 1_12 TaxID=1566278 RepID=UPI0008F16F47|nr:ABC transporter permease subunit [Paenibacillus sp. 1_12]SFM28685.1 putative aldouronate transport system permease protein [Paenibacillus sp. 1_12]
MEIKQSQTVVYTARQRQLRQLWNTKLLYLLLLPGLLHLLIFKLAPLFGLVIAFQDYNTFQGIMGSSWVGFENFKLFVQDRYFLVLLKNTLLLAIYNLVFGFPVPIIFALFLNEVRSVLVKRFTQSLSFFPYFISSAVTISIVYTFLSPQTGLVNRLLDWIGLESVFFMAEPGWFRSLYVSLNVWHSFGYGSIIYLAAIAGIDPHQYEAAEIDGASRWKKMLYITLPSLSNIIVTMFILNIGSFLSVDLDKVLLMYNPSVYETADVIQSFVYRQAFASQGFPNYSFGAAVGLFQSIVAMLLVVSANRISKKYSESRLF